jgi:hypothetical protein
MREAELRPIRDSDLETIMTEPTQPRTATRFSLLGAALLAFGSIWASEASAVGPRHSAVAPMQDASVPAKKAPPSETAAGATQNAQPPVASAAEEPPAEEGEAIDGPPPLRLDPPVLDFGIIAPGKVSEGTVRLINTGDRELEVLTVQPGCKCTTINDISGQKIPVGGFLELKSAMTAQSALGIKRAEIKILIDGYTEVVKLALVNEVSLPVRISPSYINAVDGQPQTGRIVVESIDKKPFRICSVGGKKAHIVGFDAEKDEPRNQYLIEWDFARDFPNGVAPRYWVIETDRDDAPLIDLFVRHRSTLPRPMLRLTDYRHTFGRLEEGASHEFVVDIGDLPEAERVITAASSSSVARVELVGSEREGSVTHVKLKVTPQPGTLGVQYIPFTIYTNSKQQETAVFGQWVPKGTTGCFGR